MEQVCSAPGQYSCVWLRKEPERTDCSKGSIPVRCGTHQYLRISGITSFRLRPGGSPLPLVSALSAATLPSRVSPSQTAVSSLPATEGGAAVLPRAHLGEGRRSSQPATGTSVWRRRLRRNRSVASWGGAAAAEGAASSMGSGSGWWLLVVASPAGRLPDAAQTNLLSGTT